MQVRASTWCRAESNHYACREKYSVGYNVVQKACRTAFWNTSERHASRYSSTNGGQITLNDRIIHAKEMFRISCFVEQEDALLGVLTVDETVAYALRLQFVVHYASATRTDRHLAVYLSFPNTQSIGVSGAFSPLSVYNLALISALAPQSKGAYPVVRYFSIILRRHHTNYFCRSKATSDSSMRNGHFPVSYSLLCRWLDSLVCSRRILFLDEITSGVRVL